ncbi:hypothetical protein BJ741DRAFT_1585 [Chytriomyces cf. hyalinus JEL632]|nr:hypothetical protein BJ741DRAFT_1585 [Chytriomyces cf. hyalinus JEL632]
MLNMTRLVFVSIRAMLESTHTALSIHPSIYPSLGSCARKIKKDFVKTAYVASNFQLNNIFGPWWCFTPEKVKMMNNRKYKGHGLKEGFYFIFTLNAKSIPFTVFLSSRWFFAMLMRGDSFISGSLKNPNLNPIN